MDTSTKYVAILVFANRSKKTCIYYLHSHLIVFWNYFGVTFITRAFCPLPTPYAKIYVFVCGRYNIHNIQAMFALFLVQLIFISREFSSKFDMVCQNILALIYILLGKIVVFVLLLLFLVVEKKKNIESTRKVKKVVWCYYSVTSSSRWL